MREIQGGIIIASITQVIIGCTGLLGLILQFVGPLTVVPTITLVGLSLIDVALSFCEKHWGISFLTIILVFMFSLYLRNIRTPLPACSISDGCSIKSYPIFKLLPVILAVVISWGVCGILTATDILSRDESLPEFKARTDARTDVLQISKWFFFPYPGQWGIPTISIAGVMAMFAATIASIIESVGDYYACARISGVPSPPAHAINRGIAMEGFGSIISGFVGSGGATTSYSQNVGAIGFTKVASRRVFVCAGIIFFICGIFGKFGAALTMLPDPILGGVVVISFGMVTAVGISTLQFVDLSSGRNLCIIGSSLIIGLMVPRYMSQHKNAIDTGVIELDQVISVLLSTAMFVGGVLGFILDNTVPGTDEERGILKWRNQMVIGDKTDLISSKVYDLPYITPFLFKYKCFRYIPFLPTFKMQPVLTCCKKKEKDSKNTNHSYYDNNIVNKSNCKVVGTKSYGELSTVTEVTSL
ncbi:hypothetical protein KUTeg_015002 [Tegillarca granosa]|uniref:Solute carrier family 23 member 2 n=1 Tax=Tegillarca granosa TaxID=220873 RepID=A0ABQ9ENV2_TEGGR|nr:hypothetical protein KUTeg_015002 [Tegillarca granosa]